MSVVDQQIQVNVGLIILGNPQATINTVRIRDNARAQWFSPYPEGEAVSCLPGAGAITVAFGVQNTGDADGTIFGRITDSDGRTLLDENLTLAVGQSLEFMATFDMPSHDIVLTILAGHGTPPPPGGEDYTITVYSNLPSEYVMTNPSGAVTQGSGSTLQVSAIADADVYIYGYLVHVNFSHWELDGANIGSANPIIVTFDGDYTLVAIYVTA